MKSFVLSTILLSFFFLNPNTLEAKRRSKIQPSKERHPIYHFILTLRPKINKRLAMKYSNSFYRYSRRYNLDPYLLVSIAMQESGISPSKIRVVKGYVAVDDKYVPMEIETDFCMMQIHYRNVEKMNLDLKKLQTDYDYCISIGAKILASFKKIRKDDDEFWWSRYNARSPYKRRIYESLVNRYYELRP